MKGSILLSVALVSLLSFSTFAQAEDKLPDTATKNHKVENKKLDVKMAKHSKKGKHHKCHKHCKKCHCKGCHRKHCHCKSCHCKHGCKQCHCCKKHKVHLKKLAVKPIKPIDPANAKPVIEKSNLETPTVIIDPAPQPVASTDAPAALKPEIKPEAK